MKNKNKCSYSVSRTNKQRGDGSFDREVFGIEECSGAKGRVIPFKDIPSAEKWRIRMARNQLTNKQQESLKRVIKDKGEPDVEQDYGEYYGVIYGRLFIGIEEDGYTHT